MLLLTLVAGVIAGGGEATTASLCDAHPEYYKCKHWRYPAKNIDWGKSAQTCFTGNVQSPVNLAYDSSDLSGNYVSNRDKSIFHYTNKVTVIKRKNNGHTLTSYFDMANKDNYIQIGSVKYYLYKANMRMGSENFVKGVQKKIEVQFVHLDTRISTERTSVGGANPVGPNLAVFGAFFEVKTGLQSEDSRSAAVIDELAAGPASTFTHAKYGTLNEAVPTTAGAWSLGTTSSAWFLKAKTASNFPYANFIGSLTTPPCAQGVNWFVDLRTNLIDQASHDALKNKFFTAGWNSAHRSVSHPASTATGTALFNKFTTSNGHVLVETDGNFRAPQNQNFPGVHADNRGTRNMATYPIYYSDEKECPSSSTRNADTGICAVTPVTCNAGSATCPGHDLAVSGRAHADSGYNNVFAADSGSTGTNKFKYSNPTLAPTQMPSACANNGGNDANCIATKPWWIGGLLVFFGCYGGFAGFVAWVAKKEFDSEGSGSEGSGGKAGEMEEA